MSEIVSLAKFKEDNARHNSGPAVCLECRHEWVAVAPVGIDHFECPSCHTHKGIFAGLTSVEGAHFKCQCGNFYFCITPQGTYCPRCGEEHVFDGT